MCMFSGLHQLVDVTGQRLLMWRVIWVYTGSISLPRYYTNMLSYNVFHTQMYSDRQKAWLDKLLKLNKNTCVAAIDMVMS